MRRLNARCSASAREKSRPLGGGSARSPPRLALRQIRGDVSEVPQPWRALGEIALEPAHRRLFVLRRAALRVEMDELQEVFQRQVRELASSVLGQP